MTKALSLVLFISLTVMSFKSIQAQETDIVKIDSVSGKEILVGAVTREGLQNFGEWFDANYETYSPDSDVIKKLMDNTNKLPEIFVVLATWCGDSREHVPHFFKIIDQIGYPEQKIFMVSVDRSKKGGDFCLADFNINLVPTFIFTRGGEEIGRIIEAPETTLENDLLKIVTGANN